MSINFIRGFRRVGCVATFPLAALIVLAFYEKTKEFSPANYEVTQETDNPRARWAEIKSRDGAAVAVELDGIGVAFFSSAVPKDIVERILKDFWAKHKPSSNLLSVLKDPEFIKLSPEAKRLVLQKADADFAKLSPTDQSLLFVPWLAGWTFTVHKQVNILKLAGLIVGSFGCVTLIIQGSISILAWILRGFKA